MTLTLLAQGLVGAILSLPPAVLAVRGAAQLAWARIPRYRWTLDVLAIAAVTVPGIAYETNFAHRLTAPRARARPRQRLGRRELHHRTGVTGAQLPGP